MTISNATVKKANSHYFYNIKVVDDDGEEFRGKTIIKLNDACDFKAYYYNNKGQLLKTSVLPTTYFASSEEEIMTEIKKILGINLNDECNNVAITDEAVDFVKNYLA